MKINLGGIFPPVPTSFSYDDQLLTAKLKENIALLNNYALSGYLILGSNGELVHLSEDEKLQVYNAAREAIPPDKLMLAGTGAQSTAETVRLTRAAVHAGADAVLVLNPSYYKGSMTRDALMKHYFDVADSSDAPVIIYNMPANSGLDLDADTVIALSAHENIIGLKDSGGNIAKMALIIDETKTDFMVLSGSAGFLLPALSIGAVGGILALANIAPQQCISLFDAWQSENYSQAAFLQRKIVRLNAFVTREWGVPALKAAMDNLGYYGGPCRKPVQNLAEAQLKKLTELIQIFFSTLNDTK